MSLEEARRVRIWMAIGVAIGLVGFLADLGRVSGSTQGGELIAIAVVMIVVAIVRREPDEAFAQTDPGTAEDRRAWLESELEPALLAQRATTLPGHRYPDWRSAAARARARAGLAGAMRHGGEQ